MTMRAPTVAERFPELATVLSEDELRLLNERCHRIKYSLDRPPKKKQFKRLDQVFDWCARNEPEIAKKIRRLCGLTERDTDYHSKDIELDDEDDE
jgi:hypothetical protein